MSDKPEPFTEPLSAYERAAMEMVPSVVKFGTLAARMEGVPDAELTAHVAGAALQVGVAVERQRLLRVLPVAFDVAVQKIADGPSATYSRAAVVELLGIMRDLLVANAEKR